METICLECDGNGTHLPKCLDCERDCNDITGTCDPKCPEPCTKCKMLSGGPYCVPCEAAQCEECIEGKCEDTCDDPANCKQCDGEGGCPVCNGDPNKFCCNGNCCQQGKTCCPSGVCCNPGETCCDDNCCDPDQCCVNGQCSSSCWTIENVPADAEICPDCQPMITGCEGSVKVTLSYEQWTGASGYGYCKHPTKTEVVGHLYECTENWNGDVMALCGVVVGMVCYIPCGGGPLPCALCVVGVGLACSIPNGICNFVENCEIGLPISDVEEQVVDWSKDFGPFTKCGG